MSELVIFQLRQRFWVVTLQLFAKVIASVLHSLLLGRSSFSLAGSELDFFLLWVQPLSSVPCGHLLVYTPLLLLPFHCLTLLFCWLQVPRLLGLLLHSLLLCTSLLIQLCAFLCYLALDFFVFRLLSIIFHLLLLQIPALDPHSSCLLASMAYTFLLGVPSFCSLLFALSRVISLVLVILLC